MSIQVSCGPHCGITGPREGHCDCGLCHDGGLLPLAEGEHRREHPNLGTGTPMCERQGHGLPGGEAMTAPASSGRPERPRVLMDVELVSLTLDPAGSPYSGRPEDAPTVVRSEKLLVPEAALSHLYAPQAFPAAVTCPLCHEVTPLPDGGSDDELELFWEHLRTHTTHPLVLIQLWVTAMGRAR